MILTEILSMLQDPTVLSFSKAIKYFSNVIKNRSVGLNREGKEVMVKK